MPGIGPKSAERIAVWMMQRDGEFGASLADALTTASTSVLECEICGFFSTLERGCAICESLNRDASVLCVVEQPTDILPLERSGAFRGYYHSLRGKISPLDHIGPEDLRIGELIGRLRDGTFTEVILALSTDVEGEATGNYISELLREFSAIQVSRLAQGISVGGGLESADDLTLMRALEGRVGVS